MLEGAFEDRYKVDFVGAAAHRLKRPSKRWMRGTQEGSVPAGSAEELLLPLDGPAWEGHEDRSAQKIPPHVSMLHSWTY